MESKRDFRASLAIPSSRISRWVIEFKLKANGSRALKGKDRFNEDDGIST